LSPSQVAVQSCHAVIEASKAFRLDKLKEHPSVIILSAKNETKLNRVRKYLVEQGICHVHFCEPDIEDQLTAIATEPIDGERRELLSKYQLFNNTPDFKRNNYAVKYSDGYYRWGGDCARSHRVHNIEYADLYSNSSEAQGWNKEAQEIIRVEVCYHVKKGGAK